MNEEEAKPAPDPAPAPAPEPEPGEKPRNPIGWEFWAGRVALVVASALLAVWLAVHAGSREAARFSQYNECRSARNALRVIRTEVEANVVQLRLIREQMKTKRNADYEIRTDSIRLGATKSYAAFIDAALLSEIQRIFAFPLSDVETVLSRGNLAEGEREAVTAICTRVIDRVEKVIVPMMDAQDRELEAAERRLKGGR